MLCHNPAYKTSCTVVTFKQNWFGPHRMVHTQGGDSWVLLSVWLRALCARRTCKYETEEQHHWLHWCIQTLLHKNTIHHWWRDAGQVYEGPEPRCAKGTLQAGFPNLCSCLPDSRASSLPGSCDRSTSSKHLAKPKQKQTRLHKEPISPRWILPTDVPMSLLDYLQANGNHGQHQQN